MICIGCAPVLRAADGCQQTPDEFRAKLQAFITEKAELTPGEAAKFFPVYFELQDKKRAVNDKVWKQIQKGKDDNLSDAAYEEVLLNVYDLRIEADKLDKVYYEKFKAILSPKKIYMVQRADTYFHRELVRNVHSRGAKPPVAPKKRR